MAEKLLEELSNKFNEIYDLELNAELTDIFVKLTDQNKEDNFRYFSLAIKLVKLQVQCEKLEKERGQVEYDKEYFWKILREE